MVAKSPNPTAASPQCAETAGLEARLRRGWKSWLATYVVAAAVSTLLLGILMPKMGWVDAFLFVSVLGVGVLVAVASAWYGYRKYTGPRARKSLATFLLTMLASGVVAAIIVSIEIGKPLTEMGARKVAMIFAAVAVLSGVLVAIVFAIAFMRNREVAQHVALLQAEADRERFSRQTVQAELKLLQAQVEPHFLFNTLANLRFLVQTQSPHALPMLDHLILYLRTALPEIRAESSTVGREVELARAYLEILRIRMGGALDIATGVPAELASVPFPPLVVLTLVENAIKHGIAPVGRGRVSVSAAAQDGRLRVSIEDDGRGLDGPIGQGVGLGNVRERLRALYGESARLDLAARAGGGTVAAIEVPL